MSETQKTISKTGSSFKVWHRILVFLCLFSGIGAIWGVIMAIIQTVTGAFAGTETILPTLQEVPLVGQYLNTLLLPGILLLLFCCIPQMTAGILLLRKQRTQYRAGAIVGILMVVFTVGEIILMPNFLSWIYMFLGIVEIVAGVVCSKQRKIL